MGALGNADGSIGGDCSVGSCWKGSRQASGDHGPDEPVIDDCHSLRGYLFVALNFPSALTSAEENRASQQLAFDVTICAVTGSVRPLALMSMGGTFAPFALSSISAVLTETDA